MSAIVRNERRASEQRDGSRILTEGPCEIHRPRKWVQLALSTKQPCTQGTKLTDPSPSRFRTTIEVRGAVKLSYQSIRSYDSPRGDMASSTDARTEWQSAPRLRRGRCDRPSELLHPPYCSSHLSHRPPPPRIPLFLPLFPPTPSCYFPVRPPPSL